jgi:isopenicillin N synthase-like dioxygenase
MADFTSIPILDYELLSKPETRPVFIQQLQDALVNVGFLYLEHPPVPTQLFDEMIACLPRLFDLPLELKDELRTDNSPCFFGYTRLGIERTRGILDQREQFDFGTPLKDPTNGWTPDSPEYVRLWGESQVSS